MARGARNQGPMTRPRGGLGVTTLVLIYRHFARASAACSAVKTRGERGWGRACQRYVKSPSQRGRGFQPVTHSPKDARPGRACANSKTRPSCWGCQETKTLVPKIRIRRPERDCLPGFGRAPKRLCSRLRNERGSAGVPYPPAILGNSSRIIVIAAGPTSTTKIPGKMNITRGKISLTAVLAAFSSASWRRRVRMESL